MEAMVESHELAPFQKKRGIRSKASQVAELALIDMDWCIDFALDQHMASLTIPLGPSSLISRQET